MFVDGNNWFHTLKNAGVTNLAWLNYAKISSKLAEGRRWAGTRYYVGQVRQFGSSVLHAEQRRYTAWLESLDVRVSVHFGRLERHHTENLFARELLSYLGTLRIRIDRTVYQELVMMANRNKRTSVMVEKEVDVMLAVDMVRMADRDEYDVAYLLSADGDYAPAVVAASNAGKKVFAVSVDRGGRLAAVAYRYIRLDPKWLRDCFG
ncbi:MAG TPA: NYN domain-containing protein [Candidatus Polarisedimenticolaceae bacterium]|nr:NYN domain-containing protein [Candidatus Polarisedimenticolaceae bacterium]